MIDDDLQDKIERLQDNVEEIDQLKQDIEQGLDQQKDAATNTIVEELTIDGVREEYLDAFADQPYKLLPKSENEAYVVVPRFVPFNVGWLERQDPAWNVYVVNKYVDWITELPDEIRDKVGIDQKYDKAKVDDGTIEFSSEDERDQAWDDLDGRDGGLNRREGDTEIQIKNGKEFEVIAELIDQGNLPFTPQPVADEDLRPEQGDVDLRSYQERAWEQFKETGMVGIYWSPGAGKTFIALYAGDRLDGKKLVVVPTSTLEDQWNQRIEEFCSNPDEWEVRTYQYITNYHMDEYQDKDITLTIWDECHYLPANSFSKMATIDTTYRMGLSASPYREDNRTRYIFALTGYPIGLKWQELIELGAVQEPDVTVYLYSTQNRKRKGVQQLVAERAGNLLIFCDSIQKGKRLSEDLDVPFVHGETTDRMQKFADNRVVIGSRVADEGVSLDDLDTVIEYDFHGGSRRQEAQRVGRLMHGNGKGEHLLLMTDEEYQKYSQRLYSLEEQGFTIKKERRR